MMNPKHLFALFGLCGVLAAAALPVGAAGLQMSKHHAAVIKDCAVCHTQDNAVAGNAFVVPHDKVCMSCHGSYEALAKKTENLSEPNPHRSHHYGTGLSCTACHAEHSQPRAYCNECHEFKYTMP